MQRKKELWLPVKGYEGRYEVSNYGNVVSLNYRQTGEKRPLIIKTGKDGYLRVTLCKKSICKSILVHRLVAEAFIPNHGNKPFVDHIDTDRKNNCVWNLKWCDRKENANNPITLKRMGDNLRNLKRIYGKQMAMKRKIKVAQYTLDGELVRVWDSAKDIEISLSIPNPEICNCCKGNRKTARGYIWKYYNNVE